MTRPQRRYPTKPVEDLLLGRFGPPTKVNHRADGCTIDRAAAELDIKPNVWARAVARGWIYESTADTWATALGMHPSDIWPDQYWNIPVPK